MSSVEPELIWQVQIVQHDLVILVLRAHDSLQMGFCHISGICLNIPRRCSIPDKLPFNYNLLLLYND